jgi:hypothetical protein
MCELTRWIVPGVGEHVEDVALWLGGIEAFPDVRCAERAVLLPVPLPPRLDLVIWVRPPRHRLHLPTVSAGARSGAAASSEARGATDGEEDEAAPVGRCEGWLQRLELQWELKRPLERQGHRVRVEWPREQTVVAKYKREEDDEFGIRFWNLQQRNGKGKPR